MSRWPQSISASRESTTAPWSITKVGFSLAFSTVANLISRVCVLSGGRNSVLGDEIRRIRTEWLAGRGEGRHNLGVHLIGASGNADRSQKLSIVVTDVAVVSHFAVLECLLHLADTVIEIQAAIEAELALNLLERHAIIAAVRIFDMFHLSVREVFANLGGDIRQRVVQVRATDVEDLTAD